MPALIKTDVGDIVRKFNETYQPKGACLATPRRMKKLLDELEEYTDEVQFARNKYKALGIASIAIGPGAIAVSELLGGGDVDVAQWRLDMTNWQYRLAEYQRVLESIPPELLDTVEGCTEIYPLVTAPLLDGIFYTVMPGIPLMKAEKQTIKRGDSHCPAGQDHCDDVPYRASVDGDHPMGHSLPKVPDGISPFTLGNQIIVYQDFQKENAIRFFEDLAQGARDIIPPPPGEWPWWVWAAIIGAGGTVLGLLGLYAYQFLPKPPQRNPRRKLSPRRRKIGEIVRRFPADSKRGRGERTKLLLTGDVARAVGKNDHTPVVIADLTDAQIEKLHTAVTKAA